MAKVKARTSAKAKKNGQIRIWSPSVYSLWSKCARRAKYKYIDHLADPGGAAMQRGDEIHGAAESYIRGHAPTLHAELRKPKIKKLIESLRSKWKERLVKVELFLAFDKDWNRTDGSNSNPKKWLGLKADALEMFRTGGLVKVFDWKTGKLKDEKHPLFGEYVDQIELYNIAALSNGFGDKAESALVFTDAGQIILRPEVTVSRPKLRLAQKKWEDRVAPMLNDKIFAPRPGNECRWCPYSANNDGPCEF